MKKLFTFIIASMLIMTTSIQANMPSKFTLLQSPVTKVTTLRAMNTTTSITISFLGDCMLASYCGTETKGTMNYYIKNSKPSYFFSNCMKYISNDDFTVANCENVFTDSNLKKSKKDMNPAFWFRGPTKGAKIFSTNSIDAVSLSNNHSNDYGSQGLLDTQTALDKENILWGYENKPIILTKNNVKIGIICNRFWNASYVQEINKQIKELSKTTDIQIVFFHGGKERLHAPEQWKISGCHSFVDAGADLVVGAHPHVLQPYEEYKGVSIIYSIGNFCFGGNRKPENRTIIYQETFVVDQNHNITSQSENIIPYYVYTGSTNNWQPSPIIDKMAKQKVLDFMYSKRDLPM